MRKRNSSLEVVEGRPVQEGDTVVIDYEGFKDGVAFEGGKGENYSLKIGSKTFIPGFEDQVIGHNVDEEFAIDVTFPEDYHSEELKGAAVTFNVKIHNIKEEKIPELDDEFVKDVSEFDTLDELKADIRKNQTEAAEKAAKDRFENDVVKAVVENATLEVPSVMIDNEIENMVQDQTMRMSQQGIELDMYLKYTGQTMDQFREGMKPMAETRVKSMLVLEAVSKEIKMEATEEDLEEEYKRMAEAYKMEVKDIKDAIGDNDAPFKDQIIGRKTVEYLAEKAVKTEPSKEEKKDEE